jgi:YhcH/YjgK/YiaL family protein
MILDCIENAEQYYPAVRGLKEVMEALKRYPKEPYHTGRTDVEGERIFFLANKYETKEPDGRSFMEAHKKYIDVMYMVEGEETIYVQPTNRLDNIVKEYDAAADALLGSIGNNVTAIRLMEGQFAVLFRRMPTVRPVRLRKLFA